MGRHPVPKEIIKQIRALAPTLTNLQISKNLSIPKATVRKYCKGLRKPGPRLGGGRKQGKKWTDAISEAGKFIVANTPVTLRQIYYHLVAHGFIPKNKNAYIYLGDLIGRLRKQGQFRNDIVDSNRPVEGGDFGYNSPEAYIESQIDNIEFGSYCRKAWRGQTKYIEVWIEKEALLSSVGKVCRECGVKYSATKGFSSHTSVIKGVDRFPVKEIEILLLSDHDPSGLDMLRALQENMDAFNNRGLNITVTRIGLNQAQIAKYNKQNLTTALNKKDPALKRMRYPYQVVWELDCLEPAELQEIVKEEIEARIDSTIWNGNEKEGAEEKEHLEEFKKNTEDYLAEVTEELKDRWDKFKQEMEKEE